MAGGGWPGAPAEQGTRRTAHRPAGTQNYSGQSVFSVIPVEGVMDPGKAQDFTVTFSPDHESLYFSDRLRVLLLEKVRLCQPSLDPLPMRPGPFLPSQPGILGAPRLGCRQVERPVSQLPRAHVLPEPHSPVTRRC